MRFLRNTKILGFNSFATGSNEGVPCFVGTNSVGANRRVYGLNRFCTGTCFRGMNGGGAMLCKPTCGNVPVTMSITYTLTGGNLSIPFFFGHGRRGSRNRNNIFMNCGPRSGRRVIVIRSIVATNATVERDVRVLSGLGTGISTMFIVISHGRGKRARGSTVTRINRRFNFPMCSIMSICSVVRCLRRSRGGLRGIREVGGCLGVGNTGRWSREVFGVEDLVSVTRLSLNRVSTLLRATGSVVRGPRGCGRGYGNGGLTALFFRPSAHAELDFRTTVCRLNNGILNFSRTRDDSTTGNRDVTSATGAISYCTSVVTVHRPGRNTPLITDVGTAIPVVGTNSNKRGRPARALTSLLAVGHRGNNFSGLAINFYNSLGFNEAMRSLVATLHHCGGIGFVFVSPGRLGIPRCVGRSLGGSGFRIFRAASLRGTVPDLSVLCVAHIRQRHFFGRRRCLHLGSDCVLAPRGLLGTGDSLTVLRPLPHMGRVDITVSGSPHTYCFGRILGNGFVQVTLVLVLLRIRWVAISAVGGKVMVSRVATKLNVGVCSLLGLSRLGYSITFVGGTPDGGVNGGSVVGVSTSVRLSASVLNCISPSIAMGMVGSNMVTRGGRVSLPRGLRGIVGYGGPEYVAAARRRLGRVFGLASERGHVCHYICYRDGTGWYMVHGTWLGAAGTEFVTFIICFLKCNFFSSMDSTG